MSWWASTVALVMLMVCMRKSISRDSFTKSPEEWLPLPKLAERKPSVDCGGFDKKSNIRFSDKILQSVQNYKSWTRIFCVGILSNVQVRVYSRNTMMCMIYKKISFRIYAYMLIIIKALPQFRQTWEWASTLCRRPSLCIPVLEAPGNVWNSTWS